MDTFITHDTMYDLNFEAIVRRFPLNSYKLIVSFFHSIHVRFYNCPVDEGACSEKNAPKDLLGTVKLLLC